MHREKPLRLSLRWEVEFPIGIGITYSKVTVAARDEASLWTSRVRISSLRLCTYEVSEELGAFVGRDTGNGCSPWDPLISCSLSILGGSRTPLLDLRERLR